MKRRPVPPTYHLKTAIREIDKIVWKLHDEQLAAYIAYVLAVSQGEKREIRKLFGAKFTAFGDLSAELERKLTPKENAGPVDFQPMRPRWRLCTTQRNGSDHAWKPPTFSKGDSRTALWMNRKRNIQRPLMLANVGLLLERREAHGSRSWNNPEAKPQSRATVRSRAAVMTLDSGESEGNPGLSADAVAFCLYVLMCLASCR